MILLRHRVGAAGLIRCALAVGSLLASGLLSGDGLHQAQQLNGGPTVLERSRWGEIRMDQDARWSGYDRFILESATVSFRKNWVRDQRVRYDNRLREEDIQRIKSDLASQLDEIFTRELTANGTWSRSDSAGTGVIQITPAIVDLDISAPDRLRKHIGYSLADSKGRMTLELQISDSLSKEVLAHITESRQDPRLGYFEWTTTAQNRLAARQILWLWGSRLREWLEEQRQSSSTPVEN